MRKILLPPPVLAGIAFSDKEKEDARQKQRLLFISIMTRPTCNLRCLDCYVGEKGPSTGLSYLEMKNVLRQAHCLGAKTLRIAGEGEPLCDPLLSKLLDFATKSLNMNAFVFTNGTLIDKKWIWSWKNNSRVTVVVKFSGSPRVMEYLTGECQYFIRDKFVEKDGLLVPRYLAELLDAGLNTTNRQGESRLGIEFLLRKANMGYATDIFRWCRRNNIVPYFEQNLEAGRAISWAEYSQERVLDFDALRLSRHLKEIDETEFGFTWRPSLPYLVGGICETEKSGCKKFTYNIVVATSGEVYPCYAAYFSLGNIKEMSLKECLTHPVRQELLAKPCYNCLCRVYSRSVLDGTVESLDNLKKVHDYE